MKNTLINISLSIALLLTATPEVQACQMIDFERFMVIMEFESRFQWFLSLIIAICFWWLHIKRKLNYLLPSIISLIIVFHPSWTVQPTVRSDCSVLNVHVSQVLTVFLGITLLIDLVVALTFFRKKQEQEVI